MQIVINLPKEIYESVRDYDGVISYAVEDYLHEVEWAIKNGTPLPKEHGDLITKEQAIELVEFYQMNPQHFNFVDLIDEIKDEKAIIEADKESEEEA